MVTADVERETAEPRIRSGFIDLQAEDYLVTSLFIEPRRVVREVQGICGRSDFHDSRLGELFEVMVTIAAAGKISRGDDRAWIEAIRAAGGMLQGEVAIRMSRAACTTTNARFYAERIARLSKLRKVATVIASELKAMGDESDPDVVVGNLEAYSRQIAAGGAVGNARTINEIWRDVASEYVELATRKEEPALLSGIADCDRVGFVFVPGELSILAARPGNGKTTLATQLLMHHAGKGRPVMFASLEMSERELGTRTLCQQSGLNHQLLRASRVTHEDAQRLQNFALNEDQLPLYVWAYGRTSVAQIHAQARYIQQTKGLRLLAVDYLGLVRPGARNPNRVQEVGDITKGLRDIAQQLRIPVLVLCQLNRGADTQRPRLANLRESGDIEQDADVVAFVHRCAEGDKVEFIVEKNRHGSPGIVELTFDGMSGEFKGHNALTDGNQDLAGWNKGVGI